MTSLQRGRGLARATLFALAFAAAAAVAGAQGGRAPDRSPAERAQLEQQLRQRFATVVQQRLRLTDAQMTRLRQTNARFEKQRRDLVQQEREVRVSIRDELAADSAANQARVADLIQRAIGLQRQRLDLVDAEQKELAQFMTPVQRARYLDLQEKIRQRVEKLRRQQQLGGGQGGGRGMPGGRHRFQP